MLRRCVPAPASGEAAVGRTEVHSCINIYNFRQQFRDRFVPWKCCPRTTIRRVEETAGFVIFSKCFVVFSKCCLRGPSDAFRVAVRYEKTPEQARDSRRSAPMLCKDTIFFAEIQIARFRVNISRTAMEAGNHKSWEFACLVSIGEDKNQKNPLQRMGLRPAVRLPFWSYKSRLLTPKLKVCQHLLTEGIHPLQGDKQK